MTALAGRISDSFWRRPGLLTLLLLAPPALWLGVVYLGSLFALLAQSFFSIDEFSGLIVHEFTLKTYAELFSPTNLDIILRTVVMAALVTVASAAIAFPVAYYAARYARGWWRTGRGTGRRSRAGSMRRCRASGRWMPPCWWLGWRRG